MSQQEIVEVTLPKSGAKVALRNYVRVGDRRRINKFLLSTTDLDSKAMSEDSIHVSGERAIEAQEMKVQLLLVSYKPGDDQPAIDDPQAMWAALMDLRDEEDMQAIDNEVAKIFGDGEAADTEKK